MLQATLPEIKLALSSKSRDLLSHVISECMQMRGRILRVHTRKIYARERKKRKDDPQCYEHCFPSNEARANPRMDDDICWLSLLFVLLFVREVSISDHSGVFPCSPQKPKFPNFFSI